MPEATTNIIVWAGLRVKDGAAAAFKKLAEPVVNATRKEAGCLRYDLLQDSEDPQKFYFFEEYADEKAYQAHREMPYMAEFRPKREELLDKYLGLRTFSERFIS